jgi:hypothetical protein
MITTILLLASSIIAVATIAWFYRESLIRQLPSKEAVNTFCLIAPVVLLLCIGLLPDIFLLVSTINLMPHFLRTILGIGAAACIIYSGCSKKAETPKPHPIHWRAPESGYTAETVTSPPDNKESP